MRDDFARLFSKLLPVDPPARLYHTILAAIAMRQRRLARIRVCIGTLAGVSSGALLLPAFYYLYAAIGKSAVFTYISLLGSDYDITLTYWHDFGLSLLESLPIVEITAVLAACFLLIASFAITSSNIRAAFPYQRTA